MNPFNTKLRPSLETGMTPSKVAESLRSKDPEKIRSVMSEHRILAAPSDLPSQRYVVHDVTDTQAQIWRPGRYLGWNRPHLVRTFELKKPEEDPGITLSSRPRGREVDATYVPGTLSPVWNKDLGNIDAALSQTKTVQLGEGRLGVTPEMTGCSLVRMKNASIGHLQPPVLGKEDPNEPLVGVRAQNLLAKRDEISGLFGPIEYGHQRGAEHHRTGAVMIGGGTTRPTAVISQSLYGTDVIEHPDSGKHELRRLAARFNQL